MAASGNSRRACARRPPFSAWHTRIPCTGPATATRCMLGVSRTPPFLHHGRAKTLHEVFTAYNGQDKHGKTSQLGRGDVDDLVEFLRSLPFEAPPAVTPNAVTFRVPPEKK